VFVSQASGFPSREGCLPPGGGGGGTRPATDPEADCFAPFSGEVNAWSNTSTSSCISL
jgi:hypothetical protein